MDIPAHPESEDTAPARRSSLAVYVLYAVIAIALAVLVILHLTGVVGPGAQ